MRHPTLLRVVTAAALVATLVATPVQAKPGGGGSVGSRGDRTFSAPPPTATAPRASQPMQRTETPYVAPRPSAPAAAPSRPFGGFGTGLAAGLLGAGLFGLLAGHGFAGGLSGLSSMFGLLLQLALIAGAVWLVLRFVRGRTQPAMAGAGYQRSAAAEPPRPMMGGGAGPAPATAAAVVIAPADYAAFEKTLGDIQVAYGREDLSALGTLATPEMVRYFTADLEENKRRGLRNEVSDAVLLQGDLSEAWREGSIEYATVAMRFTVRDAMVDRASGRVVEGSRETPTQSVELWTFRRDRGSPWRLSAIQQAR